MNYKKLAAAAAVLAMLAASVSCGSDADDSDIADTTAAVTDTTDGTAEKTTAASTTTATGKSGKSEKTTSGTTDTKSTMATAAQKAGGTTVGGNSSGGSSGGQAKTTQAGSGGGQSSSGTDSPAAEEKTYDAEITFGAKPTASGSNVTIEGTAVKITAGGKYRFKGKSSEGQILVSTATEEKVGIVLDGVDITCTTGPAVFIEEAKKCTIELADGSTNYLRDTVKDKVYDGVIFSNDTLRIKGGGSLEITAGNRHGIASDDDIIIESGTYTINSVKSGIYAHDEITVNDGKLTVLGGTNGIKSRGTVNINGGTMYISGGTKEEKHSIYASVLNYTGGTVFAAGSRFTEPKTSSAPYVGFGFGDGGAADSELTFCVNGREKGRLTPHNDFMSAVMFLPDLSTGDKVSILIDGESAGEYEITGTKNQFMID